MVLETSIKRPLHVFFPLDYVDNSLDCNDANPSITLPLWYLDNDGDGDGDINNTFENCEPPENYVQKVATVMTIIQKYPALPQKFAMVLMTIVMN